MQSSQFTQPLGGHAIVNARLAGGRPLMQPMGHTAYHQTDGLLDFASTSSFRQVSFIACAFHGYRRNHSIIWAAIWGLLGSVAPVLTPVVAVAQGFGKEK